MTVIRSKPVPLGKLALRKELVLTTQRGQLIATSWPRKRGKPKAQVTIEQNAWLKWTARALPYAASVAWDTATRAAKGTGLYPRDILTMAAAGKLYDIVTPEGQVLTTIEEKMEFKVFNGAILVLDSNLAMAGSVPLRPNWPLPVIDTFSFWAAGSPDRLTIPTGVTVVQLTVQGRAIGAPTTRFFASIQDSAGINVASQAESATGTKECNCTTGPINVRGGDYFRASYLVDVAMTLDSSQRTFFSIEVLESVCNPPE